MRYNTETESLSRVAPSGGPESEAHEGDGKRWTAREKASTPSFSAAVSDSFMHEGDWNKSVDKTAHTAAAAANCPDSSPLGPGKVPVLLSLNPPPTSSLSCYLAPRCFCACVC